MTLTASISNLGYDHESVSFCQVATQVLKPPVELRLCLVRPRRRQCTARLPPLASSSVVESSQPDDGGRSATLLLVAFPLPSRSLLAGPDAAISPCTRTKNSSSRLRGPTEKPHGGHFPGARHLIDKPNLKLIKFDDSNLINS
ncbi:hypothetical protein G5I_00316 [Acromyrmex echinatior]|uniref:Uncharacterized protein n=1 Tax=Acromyrmex echinatior TaxID=103372 RepID=F4W4J5_ACREC|nr:hypothetical protein G5I_00316 [Acromyrmex echinatior]